MARLAPRPSWLAAALALTAAACGGKPPTPPTTSLDDLPIVVAGDPSDLSGRWAHLQVTRTASSGGLAGTVVSTNRRVFLLDVVDDGGTIVATPTLCDVSIETSTSMASTEVPAAFVTHHPVHDWHATRADGQVAFAPSAEVLGADGLDPGDAFLTDRDDPRVADTDGDGEPGVTVRVTGMAGGELYFAQRATRTLTPTEATAHTLDGTIAWTSERVVLGATSRMLRNARPATVTDDPSDHVFRSTRVVADATCADVLSASTALFARPLPGTDGE